MTDKDAGVYFDNSKCTLMKDSKSYSIGHAYQGKLYRLNTNLEHASVSHVVESQSLWHQRMGHVNTNYVDKLANGTVRKECPLKRKMVVTVNPASSVK